MEVRKQANSTKCKEKKKKTTPYNENLFFLIKKSLFYKEK